MDPSEAQIEAHSPLLQFPYVGWTLPFDYDHPIHYLRKVLTWCGGRVIGFLGGRSSEVGRLRSTAVSFDRGMIWAVLLWLRTQYQRRCVDGPTSLAAAEAYVRFGERRYPFSDSPSEDEDVDERPHRPPVDDRLRGEVDFEVDSSSGSSDSEVSTTEPSIVTLSLDSELTCSDQSNENEALQPSGSEPATQILAACSYQAGDQGFLVQYCDGEYWVSLVGWALDEVSTVVTGLTSGNWSGFQELCGNQTEVSGVAEPSVVGSQVEGLRSRLRLGGLWLWLLILFLVPYQVRGGDSEVTLWKPEGVEDSRPTCEATVVSVRAMIEDVAPFEGEGYGGCWFEVGKVVAAIVTWELFRWTKRQCQRTKVFKAAGSQTQELGIVPMPLAGIVSRRLRIKDPEGIPQNPCALMRLFN